MPGFDRKGPMGEGSKTGRGLGKCTGNAVADKEKNGELGSELGTGRWLRRRHGGKGRERGDGKGNR